MVNWENVKRNRRGIILCNLARGTEKNRELQHKSYLERQKTPEQVVGSLTTALRLPVKCSNTDIRTWGWHGWGKLRGEEFLKLFPSPVRKIKWCQKNQDGRDKKRMQHFTTETSFTTSTEIFTAVRSSNRRYKNSNSLGIWSRWSGITEESYFIHALH